MAWYRCGGGGLPAGLQSDMDAVLNKKLGTSTTYPPADWAPTVNLMGPLPEKTASGAIANITDGADGVPLKNWLVTLPASLSGYTAILGRKNTGTGTPETQYTASLGRTIYGGTADIVTGEGEDKGVIEVFDAIEGNVIKSQFNSFNKVNGNISVLGTNVRITFVIESGDQSAYNRISNTYTADEQLCNLATHSFAYASDTTHWYRNTVLYLFLPVADVGTTAESVYNYLTGLIANGTPLKFYLPYNTAIDFNFTPITPTPETALGVNNFWADEGDTEVTYRADIDLLLGGQ